MFFATKLFLLLTSLAIVLGLPQPLPADEEPPQDKERVEEIPKIFNTPGEIDVPTRLGPIVPEEARPLDDLKRPERSAALTYYYPGVYYYPPKFRWNPYYYNNYYYWWW